jgi:hypothetical protein
MAAGQTLKTPYDLTRAQINLNTLGTWATRKIQN